MLSEPRIVPIIQRGQQGRANERSKVQSNSPLQKDKKEAGESARCSETGEAILISSLLLYSPPPRYSGLPKPTHHNKLCPALGF